MASDIDICNRGLQRIGGERIVSLSPPDGKNAKTLKLLYPIVRDSELQAHPWVFARGRKYLAATTAPEFGWTNAFTLPGDFLRLLEIGIREERPYEWEIEGQLLLTDEPAPLPIKYTRRITDTTKFSPLFVEALSARLAIELCEEITQSNTKKASVQEDYKEIIMRARHANAIQQPPRKPRASSWELAHIR